ncbi:MAG: ABC transporter permease subunit [Promicromonosporaceae bacterium]|nr:ABC transporter permease subunit [Promicromonosporaceae bacterium]
MSARLPRRRWLKEVGWRYAVAGLALSFAAFPILYVISASLDPIGSVASTSIVPTNGFSLVHYRRLFDGSVGPFPRWYLNTLIVCTFVAVVQIVCSTCAAYAFSRLRFRGRRGGLLALMLIMMFPNVLAMIAIFNMFAGLGQVVPAIGLSTVLGYCIAMTGGALGQVWLIKGTMDSIPRSLDEAARIDGAGHFVIFRRILLPILRPIIATTTLLAFVGVISEFLIGSLFLTDPNSKTLAVGLFGLLQNDRSANLGVFAAGAVLTIIPVVLLFRYLQRHIVGDATSGAVKG